MTERFTPEQAAMEMLRVTAAMFNYPQDNPIEVSVTLTDAQWSAVTFAIAVTTIHSLTEGAPDAIPTRLPKQLTEAGQIITATIQEVMDTITEYRQRRDDQPPA